MGDSPIFARAAVGRVNVHPFGCPLKKVLVPVLVPSGFSRIDVHVLHIPVQPVLHRVPI